MDEEPKTTSEVFDVWAKTGRAEGMEKGHLRVAADILAAIPVENKRFLDVGCGNGWAAAHAFERGASVSAIDGSPEMVRLARARLPEADIRVGDFADLPWPPGQFDILWSMEALYYANDPDEVIEEMQRVAKEIHVLMDYFEENAASESWPDDVGVSMVRRSMQEWRQSFSHEGWKVSTKRIADTLYISARSSNG